MKHLLIFLFISISFQVQSQSGLNWSPTIDISTSSMGNQHPRIVSDASGNPMVIWGKFSTNEIYFSKWDDTAFTAPVILNPVSSPAFVASWAGPDIASFGDTVYVVYKKIPEDSNHVFLLRSFDGGLSFSSPIQVDSLVDSLSRFPTVAADSIGNPVIAYMKFELGFISASYVVCRSNDFGNTFTPDVLASMYSSGFVCDCCPAALVCSGNKSAMLYRDNFFNFRTIWCGISTDNSASFTFGMEVDNTTWLVNACPSSGPDGIIIGDSVYTVFMSGAVNGDAMCYITSASISQISPGPTVQFLDSAGGPISNQNFPRISNSGNKVGVVCRQTYNGTGQLAFYYSNDITTGLSHVFDTLASGSVSNTDIVITPEAVHVVWQDDNSETIKYRKAIFSTTSVNNTVQRKDAVVVYPLPAKNDFTIELENKNTTLLSIDLYDVSGRKAPARFLNNNKGIKCSIENLNNGIYLLRIEDSTSKVYYKKILVDK